MQQFKDGGGDSGGCGCDIGGGDGCDGCIGDIGGFDGDFLAAQVRDATNRMVLRKAKKVRLVWLVSTTMALKSGFRHHRKSVLTGPKLPWKFCQGKIVLLMH